MFIVYMQNKTEESWEAWQSCSLPSDPLFLSYDMRKSSDESYHKFTQCYCSLPSQEKATFGHSADDRCLLHFLSRLNIKTVLG